MDKQTALDILKEASWTYVRRISEERPYPAVITDYPEITMEILKTAGVDVSNNDGHGVALLPKGRKNFQKYAVFGKKNIAYLIEQGVDTGVDNRIFLPNIEIDPGDGWKRG